MKLILNEKEMLDKSIEEGYIDENKPSNTIRTLVKHYFSKGMSKAQVIDTVDRFFLINYPNYNSIKWQKSIINMANYIYRKKDYTIFDIKEVKITENELNTIKDINNIKLEKIAFTLLVYAKIYNQMNEKDDNWVNEEHKYIFSDAKVVVNVKEQGKLIHNLRELGLVGSSMAVNSTNIKVNFADKDNNVVLVISDFRNFVYEYLRWKGEKINRCEKCKILFIATNNKNKYCSTCGKDINIKKTIENRNKSKLFEIENP